MTEFNPTSARPRPHPVMNTAPTDLPVWKRTIDLACCALALPFLALFTLIMSAITKCVSPGPVFFTQERIGHNGRRFKTYKFRTMKLGNSTSVHQAYVKDLI